MTIKVPMLAFDAIDSTMLEATRQADAGAQGPLLVWARVQTGGQGRHGRAWSSPAGNLYWTMLLHAAADRPRDAGLSFAAGLAVIDALSASGVPASSLRLKWPNDVLLDGRKVAGVLVQAQFAAGEAARLVVGIGVNIAAAPAATAFPATSLVAAGLASVRVEAVRDALTARFLERFAAWQQGGLAGLRPEVERSLHGIGAPIRVALDRDRTTLVEGTSEGIDPGGGLVLRTVDGARRVIVAGDVLA